MRTRFPPGGVLGVRRLFFRRLGVFVIGGAPQSGEGTAAGNLPKSGHPERVEFFEGLVDGAAAEVAVEEIADLFSGEAVLRCLKRELAE